VYIKNKQHQIRQSHRTLAEDQKAVMLPVSYYSCCPR